ncbi:MAG: hypothetical protein ACREQ9_08490 [Candidatus Binatia bacterium]
MLTRLDVGSQVWLETERPFPRHGAEALLWRVFIDGIESYCRAILSGATNGLQYRESEVWIFSSHLDGGLTSFTNLCVLFNVDPRRLRRGLLRFRENPRADIVALLQHDAA